MIKLYCFPRSGNSREVKLVLTEKEVPYESINIHADDQIKETPEFKKASPRGKVPAIVDGTVHMSEAYDINVYLEDHYPQNPLLPKDNDARTEIRQWVMKYDKELVLKIGLLLIECILKPKEQQKETTKEKLRAGIQAALKEVEEQLDGKEYLFGDYSLGDIALTPHLAALPRLGMELGEEYPQLKLWLEKIKSRPNFQATTG